MPIRPQLPHVPTPQTRRTVEAMAAYGIPEPDIGRVVGVSDRTLRKYYRDELDQGLAKANAKVAETLYSAATAAVRRGQDGQVAGIDRGGITACIFWLKTRARWHEKVAIVGGDKEDPVVKVRNEHTFDPSKLSTDQLRALLSLADAAEPADETG